MEIQELPTRVSDKFFKSFCPDPTVMYDLGLIYEEFNQNFFNGELPSLVKTSKIVKGEEKVSYNRLKWDGRMKHKTLGTYTPSNRDGYGTIRISRRIADDPVRVKSVILHELVHQYLDLKGLDDGPKGHGPNFIDSSRRINLLCKERNFPYRVHFYDKEILQEQPVLFSDLTKSEIFCIKDLDFALSVEKTMKAVFCENYAVSL